MLQSSSNLSGAVANQSGAMGAETISKHGRSLKSQINMENVLQRTFLFFAFFCVSVTSAFSQDIITLKNGDDIQALVQEIGEVDIKYKKFDNPNGPNYTLKKVEIFMIKYQNGTKDVFQSENQVKEITKSEVSPTSIDKFDAKELISIFSIGFEVINNYYEASAELDKTLRLVDYFSNKNTLWNECPTEKELKKLKMTKYELGEEILKRIDGNSLYRSRNSEGCIINAKKLREILTQELEDWETAYDKAEKALEENIDVIVLIPPDYRYPLALSTMLGLVKNLRATTWKECADKYEEQYHRWVMETNSAESLRIQSEIRNLTGQIASDTKSIKRSSRATAIFTGLIWFGM